MLMLIGDAIGISRSALVAERLQRDLRPARDLPSEEAAAAARAEGEAMTLQAIADTLEEDRG